MTPALLLDTHEAINELAEAGMPEAQAAILVRQQVKLLEGGLAAKSDVETLRRETTEKIDAAVETLRRETAEKIDAAVETLRQETAAAINAAKLELVRWLIGAMIAGGIGIAGVVIAAIKIV